jgi:hypothetical protein
MKGKLADKWEMTDAQAEAWTRAILAKVFEEDYKRKYSPTPREASSDSDNPAQ